MLLSGLQITVRMYLIGIGTTILHTIMHGIRIQFTDTETTFT